MTLAIIGSRNCPAVDIMAHLTTLPDTIVSGGARGADTQARNFAKKHGLRLIEYFPNYALYGKKAPLVRNHDIIDECDSVLALWDGKSRGTKSAIDYARETGKPVTVVMVGESDAKFLQ